MVNPVHFGALAFVPSIKTSTRPKRDNGVPYFTLKPVMFDQDHVELSETKLERALRGLIDESVIAITPGHGFINLGEHTTVGQVTRAMRDAGDFSTELSDTHRKENRRTKQLVNYFKPNGIELPIFSMDIAQAHGLLHGAAKQIFAPFQDKVTADHLISAMRMFSKKQADILDNLDGNRLFANLPDVTERPIEELG
ncbi:MAG: hypothetical protein KC462_08845 [Cyanobacteria bacterium HKST-UBA05]|nr:hypothetical protein [Cyanobacteria bacterium HKST-UBA05]